MGMRLEPISSDVWAAAQRLLHRPKSTLRVVSAEVGSVERFGAGGRLLMNPWIDSNTAFRLSTASCSENVEDLVSHGLPLSLALALENPIPAAVQFALLSSLHTMIRGSSRACNQLNAHQKTRLKFGSTPNKPAAALAAEVETLCKQRYFDSGHQSVCQDWTGFGSSYEVWFTHGAERIKVHLCGERNKGAAEFDLGGVHLTGGRLWAGSLLLARWMASLHFANESSETALRPHLQGGPVLEVGAGLGLAGIMLAKIGYKVVLSDREPVLLDRLRENVEENKAEASCRVLNFDWAKAPKMHRLLRAQRFSAVIGADVVYTEVGADLLVDVLSHALPDGGLAFLVNAVKYRKGTEAFATKLRTAGHEVVEGMIPCESALQDSVCGSFEPDQEYTALVVHVASSVTRASS
mmetsp:Transcript_71711/g.173710  ORF Transcript_71711/g.173710 Transcript_71711/m.173710 type:complete len:408 (-) Transcript_71711:253-1476(-)